MQGVTSIIRFSKPKLSLLSSPFTEKQRPSDDVRNLFDKRTHNMERSDVNSLQELPKRKPLFEFEGRIDEGDQLRYADDNINQAIELRLNRQRHTDFFFKLHELKERIEVYNQVYRSKVPRYLRGDTLKVKLLIFLKRVSGFRK